MTRLLAPLLVTLSLASGGCGPSHVFTNADVPGMSKLSEIMWAQAQAADPAFRLIGKTALTDEDFGVALNAGERLKLTAPRIKMSFSKGPDFDVFADALTARADELSSAAGAKDAARTSAALSATKDTCKSCHKKFR